MGVKELNPFLREKTPEAIKEVLLSNFANKTIAIDTSIYFYKFLYKNSRFLEGFFQQIYRLKTNRITPIYIFDGLPPPEKQNTIKQRKEKKLEMIDMISKYEEDKKNITILEEKFRITGEINKIKKKLISVTKSNIDELKNLLDLMNIQYVQAEGEADIICGKLCKDGITDLVLSDDMDLLTSGATKVLRNFFVSSNKILYYDLNKILEILKFTKEQWIDFCILCGCDYCDRIPGLGPKKSLKLLKEHTNVSNILSNIKTKYVIPEDYIENYKKSKEIFENNIDFTFEIKLLVQPGFNIMDQIINILKERTNLSERQILNRINIIYKK